MNRTRLAYLRGELEAEQISYGELAEIESAFSCIDPATLPEPAENASARDMLDELEARLPQHEEMRLRGECHGCRNLPTEGGDE